MDFVLAVGDRMALIIFIPHQWETGIATPSEGYFLDFYTNLYNMIRVANEVIYNLDGNENITADLRDRLIGEARFFRGMGYFLLWHFFGDVVLRDKPLPVNETNLPKTPAIRFLVFVGKILRPQGIFYLYHIVMAIGEELLRELRSLCWEKLIFIIKNGVRQRMN